jgi:hypothetical protein
LLQYEQAITHFDAMTSDSEAFPRLLRAGLVSELFVGIAPDERRIFEFARSWYEKDATVPPRQVLESEFPQFFKTRNLPVESDVQPEYLVNVLKNNHIKVRSMDLLDAAAQRIFDPYADQAEVFAKIYEEWGQILAATAGGKAKFRTVDESLADEGEDWLAYPYLSFGNITAFYGHPKAGKSVFSCYLFGSYVNDRKFVDAAWEPQDEEVVILWLHRGVASQVQQEGQ